MLIFPFAFPFSSGQFFILLFNLTLLISLFITSLSPTLSIYIWLALFLSTSIFLHLSFFTDSLTNSLVINGRLLPLVIRSLFPYFSFLHFLTYVTSPSLFLLHVIYFMFFPSFPFLSFILSNYISSMIEEPLKILRDIATQHDKRAVYDRTQSQLLLRSPSTSVTVQIPSLLSVQKTEVAFGVQKSMYQNANKILLLKDNSPKTAFRTSMRHSIILGRIEQNMRKMKSMIHVMPPPTFDDMILFQTEHDGKFYYIILLIFTFTYFIFSFLFFLLLTSILLFDSNIFTSSFSIALFPHLSLSLSLSLCLYLFSFPLSISHSNIISLSLTPSLAHSLIHMKHYRS